jgi:hypothetical protein
MISQLASPSVCVIDEDPKDFEPLLAALNGLFVSTVHIRGDDSAKLPPVPFTGLRLVFLDLHLTSAGGKDATAHTANVFLNVVSPETAPLVVVIWSKYADAPLGPDGNPVEDGETEAQAFTRTLLKEEPRYRERVIFVQMEKLQGSERPEAEGEWVERLKGKINEALHDQSAIDLLWRWDNLVRDASVSVSSELTELARLSAEGQNIELKDGLKDVMQRLAKAEAGPDFRPETAPHHLATVLGQLFKDHLEQQETPGRFDPHGAWLGVNPAGAGFAGLPPHMNTLMLTSGLANPMPPFVPGTVFHCPDVAEFEARTGASFADLAGKCFSGNPAGRRAEFIASAKPVFVELSPECDVAQCDRVSSLLIGGAIVPIDMASLVKRNGTPAVTVLPDLYIRYPMQGFVDGPAVLTFCARYKVTLPAQAHPDWLLPWFRLRELPTAALRIAYASLSVRVGYTYL